MSAPAQTGPGFLLTLNAGSSSLKFAVFCPDRPGEAVFAGTLGREANPVQWLDLVVARTAAVTGGAAWAGVGHRVVHGGPRFTAPQRITPEVLAELRQLGPFAPEHLPRELALIEQVARRFPGVSQVACFDTAFHRTMPRVATLLPIPRRYEAQGLRRYGFHGLSYAFLLRELAQQAGAEAAAGRVLLAHLGNGASLAAVHRGQSVDTTMAFTPAAGLVMGTRTGDLDPGVGNFLARSERMTAAQFDRMVNHESGLLGVSETSADMRELLEREAEDVRAAEAVALFCHAAKKAVGAGAAVLGGLDTLVFSGGIGENAPPVRARICAGLGFLGLELDEARNATGVGVISTPASRVTVRVIRTDEQQMIARALAQALGLAPAPETISP